MDQNEYVKKAQYLIYGFLIGQHIIPVDSIDEIEQSGCVRQEGEHLILTVCGKCQDLDIDLHALWHKFIRVFRLYNELFCDIKWQPYKIEGYTDYRDGFKYIYFSVCT